MNVWATLKFQYKKNAVKFIKIKIFIYIGLTHVKGNSSNPFFCFISTQTSDCLLKDSISVAILNY